ncbi:MAG TPA: FtsX-like permease family protein, partial [Blastocatellia bacterium]|nr:FtsX-like permease family protein [Blastocatellia bacterium]
YTPEQDAEPVAPDYVVASPDYFAVTHIPLIAGREFTARDDENNAKAVIISKAAAILYWPNENPVGKRLMGDNNSFQEIVGVVGDVTQHNLNRAPRPCVYVPYAQDPWPFMTITAKTGINPTALVADIKRAIWAVDKDQAISNVRTMDEVVSKNISSQRFNMLLVGLFAGLALLLATIGIFGVTSFAVGQRTHEIGVRVALGASRQTVLGLVLGRSLVLTIAGAIVGVAGALALTRLMSAMLFEIRPADPLTFSAVPLLLIGATLLASYLPARRAMRVDPAVALRYE